MGYILQFDQGISQDYLKLILEFGKKKKKAFD